MHPGSKRPGPADNDSESSQIQESESILTPGQLVGT